MRWICRCACSAVTKIPTITCNSSIRIRRSCTAKANRSSFLSRIWSVCISSWSYIYRSCCNIYRSLIVISCSVIIPLILARISPWCCPPAAHPWLLGGNKDPWHSVPAFRRVWLCRFLLWSIYTPLWIENSDV